MQSLCLVSAPGSSKAGMRSGTPYCIALNADCTRRHLADSARWIQECCYKAQFGVSAAVWQSVRCSRRRKAADIKTLQCHVIITFAERATSPTLGSRPKICAFAAFSVRLIETTSWIGLHHVDSRSAGAKVSMNVSAPTIPEARALHPGCWLGRLQPNTRHTRYRSAYLMF